MHSPPSEQARWTAKQMDAAQAWIDDFRAGGGL